MTRASRRARRTIGSVFFLALVSLVAACSQAEPAADTAGETPESSSVTSPTPAPVEQSGPPTSSPREERDEAPEPGSMERPATSAGPLSQDDFPQPGTLGAGWSYSIDPGDAEEGYAGNGTPALARNPAEVVRLSVPLGCARPNRMPLPDHALEVDYTAGGTKVVAIRGEFADASRAEQFFEARKANIEGCVGHSGGQALGPLVSTVEAVADDVLLSDRTPESAPWAELALLDGDQVVLVAAQTRLGTPPMTTEQARKLAEAFRR